jgi:hypothetical protein
MKHVLLLGRDTDTNAGEHAGNKIQKINKIKQ